MKLSRLLCLSLLVGLASGCDCDVPSQNSPVGTWNLRSVSGQLPGPDLREGTSVTVTGSTLTMSKDGRYNEVVRYTTDSGSVIQTGTLTEAGTWTVSELCEWSSPSFTVVTFDSQTQPGSSSYQANVFDDSLVVLVGSNRVYGRQ